MQKSKMRKNAIYIGSTAVIIYLAGYLSRNLLTVFTPEMLESYGFEETATALLQSVYMTVYAIGQVINGFIGDRADPKYMVSIGLTVNAAGLFLFPMAGTKLLQLLAFALIGFGCSMLRGPLVRMISENTEDGHARLCCTFLSAASFVGPFAASTLALYMHWNSAFTVSGFIALFLAVSGFIVMSILSKKGIVKYESKANPDKKHKLDITGLFRLDKFFMYLLVGVTVEICASSINFWIPTFMTKHLGFAKEVSAFVFSALSVEKVICPFICLFILKLFSYNDIALLRVMFAADAALYVLLLFTKTPWLCVLILIGTMCCYSIASATMWSVYIPSLGKSGKASSANGFFDGVGYITAALANTLFAWILKTFSWSGMLVAWSVVCFVGIASTLLAKIKLKKSA